MTFQLIFTLQFFVETVMRSRNGVLPKIYAKFQHFVFEEILFNLTQYFLNTIYFCTHCEGYKINHIIFDKPTALPSVWFALSVITCIHIYIYIMYKAFFSVFVFSDLRNFPANYAKKIFFCFHVFWKGLYEHSFTEREPRRLISSKKIWL